MTNFDMVVKVTEDEKNEIKDLFFRNEALTLIKAILEDQKKDATLWLREKVTKDLLVMERLYNGWWKETSQKYGLSGTKWRVDFFTNEIVSVE